MPDNRAEPRETGATAPAPSYVGLSYLPPVTPVTTGNGVELDPPSPVTEPVTTGNRDDEIAPELDWANAWTLCLRCAWWGRRVDWPEHECSRTPDGEESSQRVTVAPAGSRYSLPWPDRLDSGERHVGPFSPCASCSSWSWVRYGATVLCLACARQRERGASA
jgi:hypothetical protein